MAACTTSPLGSWESSFGKHHTLSGKVYDVAAREFVTTEALTTRLQAADYILLGESHDNPDHHRLQDWALQRVVDSGRKPALVLEMLDPSDAPSVKTYLDAGPTDASGFGRAVNWEKKGWPDYRMYMPIMRTAITRKLPVVAGNITQDELNDLRLFSIGAIGAEVLSKLGIDSPLPVSVRVSMEEYIIRAHCGYAPSHYLSTMVMVQRARDTRMARSMLEHDSAVLIAGGEHTRSDRGAAELLVAEGGDRDVLTLAFVEIDEGANKAGDYVGRFGAERLPFDFVWFTPRSTDGDPCEVYKDQLKEKLREKRRQHPPVTPDGRPLPPAVGLSFTPTG